MCAACAQSDRNRLRGDRRGAAVVEFALTAPILFLFLFASLEFGRYNMIQQTANNAAFEAARRCIVPGATVADGQTAGVNLLKAAGLTNVDSAVVVTPNPITNQTVQVTATVIVPVTSNLWVSPMFLKSATVTKTCTLTSDWVNSTR